jgi:type VI secretion system protein ImpE
VLELFAGGRCLWLPLEQLRSATCEPPRHLLDLIWRPLRLVDAAGVTASVHLPALYAGSGRAADDALRLGRGTDWAEQGEGIWRGVGQRVLAYADGADALQGLGALELRSLTLATA